MIYRPYKLSYLFVAICLILLIPGCSNNLTNSQFTVRVSGSTSGMQFDGQCTAQSTRFLSAESNAKSLDVKGTIDAVSQSQEYETSGFFIYCAIANQSANGTITVELLQEGKLVAIAYSTSPDKPATIEYGQMP